MKKILCLVFLLLLCPLPSHGGEDVVIAKIGDRTITLTDLDRIIGYQDEKKRRALADNPSMKKTLLDRLVKTEVIAAIARAQGFDARPDIKEQLDMLINDFLTTEYLKTEIVKESDITEDDMRLYYQVHKEEFTIPEIVKARHILIKVNKSASDDEKGKAREKAEEIRRRLKGGEDFAKLASEMSDDTATREKGGDLGLVKKKKMVPEFDRVLFSLKVGETSDVVESKFGYHIIRVDEKTDAKLQPYDGAKGTIKEKVIREFRGKRASAFIERALKDAGVEMYPERIPGVTKQIDHK